MSEISGLQTIGLDLSCDGVARMQEWLHQLAARGEWMAMRDALARRGERAEPRGAKDIEPVRGDASGG